MTVDAEKNPITSKLAAKMSDPATYDAEAKKMGEELKAMGMLTPEYQKALDQFQKEGKHEAAAAYGEGSIVTDLLKRLEDNGLLREEGASSPAAESKTGFSSIEEIFKMFAVVMEFFSANANKTGLSPQDAGSKQIGSGPALPGQ